MSPLDGKRIVVTRAENQADGFCSRLEELGAIALRCPTIRLAAPASYEELDSALSRVGDYGWLVFTSANGVRFLLERMEQLGIPSTRLTSVRVAAVGTATALVLSQGGVEATVVSEEMGSEPLARTLTPVDGERILLARSDIADPRLVSLLERRGAERVDDVVAYRTLPAAPPQRALKEMRRGVDAITFTSPSTIQGFLDGGPEWRDLLADTVIASLGPVTSAAARKAGLEVRVEAEEQSMGGLVAALVRAFEG